jgi:hypothetical protein
MTIQSENLNMVATRTFPQTSVLLSIESIFRFINILPSYEKDAYTY